MNNNNYKMITAFTKLPILLRKRILQIMMFGLIFVLMVQFLLKSEYLILTIFLLPCDNSSSKGGIYFLQIQS